MSLVSRPRTQNVIGFNPKDGTELGDHIANISGAKIQLGVTTRRQQAIANPGDYIFDKSTLWRAIIKGDNGKTKLNLSLPGQDEDNPLVPKMEALGTLWLETYNNLQQYGVEKGIASAEADAYILNEYNKRVEYLSNAFPGFVEASYQAGLNIQSNMNLFTAQQTLLPGASVEDAQLLQKLNKYKKGYKKYKKSKQTKQPKQ